MTMTTVNGTEPSTGLATTHARADALVAFEPESLPQAIELAKILGRSRLLPKHLSSPEDVLLVIIKGRELGLTVMQSIGGMYVIDGKVGMDAALIVALVKRRSECLYLRLVQTTDRLATYETLREGDPEPTRMTYTIEQAQRAGLTGKDNWKRHTEAMLRARCASAICRAVFPDCMAGIYDEDEMAEIRAGRAARPRPAAAPTPAPEPAPTVIETTGEVVDTTEHTDTHALAAASAFETQILAATNRAELTAIGANIKAAGLPKPVLAGLRVTMAKQIEALAADPEGDGR